MASVKTRNSVTRGIDILKRISEGTDRVTDLAKQHGLSKSTTHRLLKSLENTSIVRRDPITRRYYIGPLVAGFGFQTHHLSSGFNDFRI